MPGYEVTPVEPLKVGLVCGECQLLLRDAVQTEEGDRLCRTCYEEIKRTGASKGGITLDGGEVRIYRPPNLLHCTYTNVIYSAIRTARQVRR